MNTAVDRFGKKWQPTIAGCWEWQAGRQKDGYGVFWNGERRPSGSNIFMLAHRWSFEHHVGPIPDGMCVLHRCDNPPCVNPAHLFLGTQRANVQDCIAKGRHRNGRQSLTDAEVALVRSLYSGHYGDSKRIAERHGFPVRLVRKSVYDLPRRYGKWAA